MPSLPLSVKNPARNLTTEQHSTTDTFTRERLEDNSEAHFFPMLSSDKNPEIGVVRWKTLELA